MTKPLDELRITTASLVSSGPNGMYSGTVMPTSEHNAATSETQG
jgi:hypothetical protein